MRPEEQTVFGGDSGNCWAACIAALLGLSINDVPNFCGDPPGNSRWFQDTDLWLKQRGWRLVGLDLSEPPCVLMAEEGLAMIATGKSPRGAYCHAAVVAIVSGGLEIVHDPHPSSGGLDGQWNALYLIVKA